MFFESGFNGTLCGSTWKTVWNNNDNKKSGAKYGCCPSGKYMSAPEAVPFSEDNSCSASCPVGRFSSAVENDDTSCSCQWDSVIPCSINTYVSTQFSNSNKVESNSISGMFNLKIIFVKIKIQIPYFFALYSL